MELIYEKITDKSFDEAVKSITESLNDKKFGVLWQLNFKDKITEHGIDFPNNFMVFINVKIVLYKCANISMYSFT